MDALAIDRDLVIDIRIRFEEQIIADFLHVDELFDIPLLVDPIYKALVFIEGAKERLMATAIRMYREYEADNALDEIRPAGMPDWYREFLYEEINLDEVLEYIENL